MNPCFQEAVLSVNYGNGVCNDIWCHRRLIVSNGRMKFVNQSHKGFNKLSWVVEGLALCYSDSSAQYKQYQFDLVPQNVITKSYFQR